MPGGFDLSAWAPEDLAILQTLPDVSNELKHAATRTIQTSSSGIPFIDLTQSDDGVDRGDSDHNDLNNVGFDQEGFNHEDLGHEGLDYVEEDLDEEGSDKKEPGKDEIDDEDSRSLPNKLLNASIVDNAAQAFDQAAAAHASLQPWQTLLLRWMWICMVSGSTFWLYFFLFPTADQFLAKMVSLLPLIQISPQLVSILNSATTIPRLSDLLKLSDTVMNDTWGVYLVVLTKANERTKLYVGSSSGITTLLKYRIKAYYFKRLEDAKLPWKVRDAIKDGYKITKTAPLIEIRRRPGAILWTRMLLRGIECALTTILWAYEFAPSPLYPWADVPPTEWSGLCSHSSLQETVLCDIPPDDDPSLGSAFMLMLQDRAVLASSFLKANKEVQVRLIKQYSLDKEWEGRIIAIKNVGDQLSELYNQVLGRHLPAAFQLLRSRRVRYHYPVKPRTAEQKPRTAEQKPRTAEQKQRHAAVQKLSNERKRAKETVEAKEARRQKGRDYRQALKVRKLNEGSVGNGKITSFLSTS